MPEWNNAKDMDNNSGTKKIERPSYTETENLDIFVPCSDSQCNPDKRHTFLVNVKHSTKSEEWEF